MDTETRLDRLLSAARLLDQYLVDVPGGAAFEAGLKALLVLNAEIAKESARDATRSA